MAGKVEEKRFYERNMQQAWPKGNTGKRQRHFTTKTQYPSKMHRSFNYCLHIQPAKGIVY